MQHYNPISALVTKGKDLSLDMYLKTIEEKNEMVNTPYSSVVESLIYATICARLDICFTIGLVITINQILKENFKK